LKSTHLSLTTYFEDINYTQENSFLNTPPEVIITIFSLLNSREVGSCSFVSREWKKISNSLIDRQRDKLFEIVFSPVDWNTYFGEGTIGLEEIKEARKSLPLCIDAISCPICPRNKMIDTFVFTYFPKNITIKKYGELLKNKLLNISGYELIWSRIEQELGEIPIIKHGWKAMSSEWLPHSSGKRFITQQEKINKLNKKGIKNFKVPKVLEAIICISTAHFKQNKTMFTLYFTRCHENIDDYQLTVKLRQNGLVVTANDLSPLDEIGVAAIRDF